MSCLVGAGTHSSTQTRVWYTGVRRERLATERGGQMTTATKTDFAAIYAQADAAGKAAAETAVPTPLVVGEETSPFSGQVDYTKPTYFVSEGLCGFAWIKFKGNTAWGRWAKKTGVAKAAYGGGMQIRVGGYGQSVTRKEAYAQAFAATLNEAGITAYAESRLD